MLLCLAESILSLPEAGISMHRLLASQSHRPYGATAQHQLRKEKRRRTGPLHNLGQNAPEHWLMSAVLSLLQMLSADQFPISIRSSSVEAGRVALKYWPIGERTFHNSSRVPEMTVAESRCVEWEHQRLLVPSRLLVGVLLPIPAGLEHARE